MISFKFGTASVLLFGAFLLAPAQSSPASSGSSPPATIEHHGSLSTDQIIAITVGILQVLATISIAVVVYRQTSRLKKIELTKQTNDAYNLLSTIALSRDENLVTFDSIGRDSGDESLELRRKRWCAFVWLVALENTFLLKTNDLIDAPHADQVLRHQLEILLEDDLVYSLVCGRGYDPKFVAHCKSIRSEIERSRSQRRTRGQS